MRACDAIFRKLEEYDEITLMLLSHSRIGKVIRHIALMDDLPFQEKFRFRERVEVFKEQWTRMVEVNDYAKGPEFRRFCDSSAISPILHDLMRAGKGFIGTVGGLNEVKLENDSGSTTVITLPRF